MEVKIMTYISNNVEGFYFESLEELQSWWTYEDFLDGKLIKLSEDQVKYHNDYPEENIESVLNVCYYDGVNVTYFISDAPVTLESTKEDKIAEITEYDNSDAINDIIIDNTVHGWFDAEERASFKTSIDAAKLIGTLSLSFFVGDNLFTVSTEDAERMLAAIQLYADLCFIVTKQHKINVNNLTTIEDVEAYDYTTGYPAKLNFTI